MGLLSFVDIRLLSSTDPQKVTDYPLIRALGNQAAKFCMVCQASVAVWVTMNNIRVPEDPFFFCGLCYKQFNFVDKKRVEASESSDTLMSTFSNMTIVKFKYY